MLDKIQDAVGAQALQVTKDIGDKALDLLEALAGKLVKAGVK